MTRMRWLAPVVLLGALVLGSGCQPTNSGPKSASEAALPVVTVAINTWPGLGPYYIARAKGFDVEEGVKLNVVMIEDTVARNTSIASGEADLIGITLDNVIIAEANGLPMTVVGESDFSFGGDGILATKDINTVADLRGKRIACPDGLPSHFLLLYLLRKNHMTDKDIIRVPADDGGQAGTLFAAGKVDAAVTWDPWISQAEKLTKGHVIVTTRDTPGLILGIVAANKTTLAQKADKITRAQKAWFRAVQYSRDHPEESNAIMAKEYNVPVAEFGPMIAGAKIADLQENVRTFGTRAQPGPVYQLAIDASELWQQAGVIKKPVKPEDVIDWTIIERLIR